MEDKKEKILAAARELFLKEDYETVSIRRIAEKAGANSAMISYYFGGKENLYFTILEGELGPARAFLDKDWSAAEPENVFRGYLETMSRIHHQFPRFAHLFLRMQLSEDPALKKVALDILPRAYEIIGGAVRRGIAAGKFRSDLTLPEALILWGGMVNFYFLIAEARRASGILSGADEKKYLDLALSVFLRGIAKEGKR